VTFTRSALRGAVLAAACLAPLTAAAQAPPRNYIEVRGARGEDGAFYRYAEYTRTLGRVVFDGVYLGVPGQNELYLGLGYPFHPTPGLTLTVLAYGVVGKENRELGIAPGLSLTGTAGRWTLYGFMGYFEPLRGDVPRYAFLDSFDVARKVGRWELGLSTGHYVVSGTWTALVGPMVVRDDSLGTWRLYVRGGSALEVRLSRTLAF
jgi:hypothetical protein